MATKKPLKIGSTGLPTEFATADAVATENGGVPSGGTTGQVLRKVNATDYNTEWATASGSVATDAIWDAKGDLAVGTGADTAAKLTVGTDGAQIYADASASTGLRWGPSIISPSQLTSDQDNYSPTGWGNCQIVRLDGDNGIRAITSLASTFSGNEKRLINVGSYPIYFPGEHPDGTAANRFTGLGSDFILYPGAECRVMYDGTSSRWRVLGQEYSPIGKRNVYYSFSAASIVAGDFGDITFGAINTGSMAGIASSTTLPIAASLTTGTASNGGEFVAYAKTSATYSAFGSALLSTSAFISIPTLSDGTETFTIAFQISNAPTSVSLTPNNTLGIRYSNGVNSGKFEAFSRDNAGSESTADLGITVTAGQLYLLEIDYDKSRSEARFYIDNVFIGRITGNMPNAVVCGSRVIILKSAGTTSRSLYLHNMSAKAVYP